MRIGNQSFLFRRERKRQEGLAALEFIICLPVLLMLAVLLIDVGRAFIQYTEINKALQNGARYAVLDTYGTLDFSSTADPAKIKNMVVYGSPTPTDTPVLSYIDENDVTVTEPTDEIKEITVSARYTYMPIFSQLPFSDISLEFTIDASSKMRTSP
ncbi:TadE/TadG family type IV pilus assembly protein [Vibrio natriegens]|uniref:TadE/TadG family type IV pilus assembly protein n=1 Tax=Vibrio natriegens TaxID=691 RepID=UPI003B5D01DC